MIGHFIHTTLNLEANGDINLQGIPWPGLAGASDGKSTSNGNINLSLSRAYSLQGVSILLHDPVLSNALNSPRRRADFAHFADEFSDAPEGC